MATAPLEQTIAAYFAAVSEGKITKRQALTRMWAALGYPEGDVARLLGFYDDCSVGG